MPTVEKLPYYELDSLISQSAVTLHCVAAFCFGRGSPVFEIANVFVRLDHVAGIIVNQNKHRIRMGNSRTKVTSLLLLRARFHALRALTRQPSLLRIVNFH